MNLKLGRPYAEDTIGLLPIYKTLAELFDQRNTGKARNVRLPTDRSCKGSAHFAHKAMPDRVCIDETQVKNALHFLLNEAGNVCCEPRFTCELRRKFPFAALVQPYPCLNAYERILTLP